MSLRQKIATKFRIRLRALLEIILLTALSLTILMNLMTLRSPIIAGPATIAFLLLAAVAMGRIFFSKETSFLKIALGMMSFVLIAAIVGVALILLANYNELLSVSATLGAGFILFVLSLRKRNVEKERKPESQETRNKNAIFYMVSFMFILLSAFAFYLLILGRTGEGTTSVWLTIPNMFLPTFFAAFFCLMTGILLKAGRIDTKLALVMIFSVLAHVFFVLVWYPGRYGDPWTHLGGARWIDSAGAPYGYPVLLREFYIVEIIGGKAQYALVVLFKRLFLVDMYWVHILLIPLLWSIFVPLFSFKIAQLLSTKKSTTFPLLAAVSSIIFQWLIYWGTISVPNSLALVFLFFMIVSLLYWIDTAHMRFLLLSAFISVATFLTHPVTGVFAFIFFLGAIVVRLNMSKIIKIFSYLLISMLYPLALLYRSATFSPFGLLGLENFLYLQSWFFSLPLIFGITGLLLGMRSKRVKTKSAGVLFLFYITVIMSYYLWAFGMKNLPSGTDVTRFVPMADFLMVPFAGLGFLTALNIMKRGFSHARLDITKKAHFSSSSHLASTIIVSLVLASLVTMAAYQAYPQSEITKVQPAAYEVDAVRYINSSASGQYVVLCDPNFATMAIGFLGIQYGYGGASRGMFGTPDYGWWTIQLYLQMVSSPSISILEGALSRAQASTSYFVVSVREPQFEEIVQSTKEVLPVTQIFGDGKLYVFAYPSPITRGTGPPVNVTFDNNISMNIETEFAYIARSEVNYNLTISGHSSYNITEYPSNWAFQSSSVNGTSKTPDQSSDVNLFVQFSGLSPADVLTVMWEANDLYPVVGWKEDSFKSEWLTSPFYAGTISPNIANSSNVLSLTWNFVPGSYQYYYYTKRVVLSTNDYPYIIVKWRSTGPVAVVGISYASAEANINPVLPYNSQSNTWILSTLQLDPNETTAYVTVGITNVGDQQTITGLLTVYVDYIMICAKAFSP